MQLAPRLAPCVAALALASSAAFGQGQLWVVDASGGPGSDFTDVQLAVDAASDGDTVLVRAGSYVSFTIDGKSLVVAKDATGGEARTNIANVRNLAAGQKVALRGLTIGICTLEQNDGLVWLESLTKLEFGAFGAYGLRVHACAAVVGVRCAFISEGLIASYPGVEAVGSSLHLYECTAKGTTFPWATGTAANVGGDGVRLEDSFLFASGCTFQGGQGGSGGACSPGGLGGNGLVRVGGPSPQLLETDLLPGLGGCGVDCAICGPYGQDAVGGYELLSGHARDYRLTSPAVGGQTTTISYAGAPGDLVFSLLALSPSALYAPALAGSLVLPIPPLVVPHGAANAAGALQTVVPVPLLPPGLEAFTVYAQSAAVSAVGAAVLGAPSQLSIL